MPDALTAGASTISSNASTSLAAPPSSIRCAPASPSSRGGEESGAGGAGRPDAPANALPDASANAPSAAPTRSWPAAASRAAAPTCSGASSSLTASAAGGPFAILAPPSRVLSPPVAFESETACGLVADALTYSSNENASAPADRSSATPPPAPASAGGRSSARTATATPSADGDGLPAGSVNAPARASSVTAAPGGLPAAAAAPATAASCFCAADRANCARSPWPELPAAAAPGRTRAGASPATATLTADGSVSAPSIYSSSHTLRVPPARSSTGGCSGSGAGPASSATTAGRTPSIGCDGFPHRSAKAPASASILTGPCEPASPATAAFRSAPSRRAGRSVSAGGPAALPRATAEPPVALETDTLDGSASAPSTCSSSGNESVPSDRFRTGGAGTMPWRSLYLARLHSLPRVLPPG